MSDQLWNGGPCPRSTHAVCRSVPVSPQRAIERGGGDDFVARRIQRSRRKGFRMPENAIYVGRPTMWGNPFEHRKWGHAKATILHERWAA